MNETDHGEVFYIDNSSASNITISDGTSAASGSTTFTITTSGSTDEMLYYDGELIYASVDPLVEMKELVSAMVEDFLEKYR